MQSVRTIAHLFYPSYLNNHKAKLLHSSFLLFLALFLVVYQLSIDLTVFTSPRVLGYAANIPAGEVIRLTNQKRLESGMPALQYSAALTQAAKAKGEHMLANDYWAHVAPDGTEPWKFFADAGYKYRYAGENLARDFSDPNSAVEAWMASSSHRENMLSGKYKEIGIAVVEGDLGGKDATIIVQLFGTQLVDTTPAVPIAQADASVADSSLAVSPTATPRPTAPPSAMPTVTEERIVASSKPTENRGGGLETLIAPFNTTRNLSIIVTFLLLVIMVIDGVVAHTKRLPRIGGRSFAHFTFLGTILAIALIAKAGDIL